MSRYLVIFISPFLYLLSFLWFFYYGRWPVFLAVFSLLVIMISLRLATRHHFWQNKLLFVNLLLAYLAEFIFISLLTPLHFRYILIFALAFVWGFVWWLVGRHFSALKETGRADYLPALKFFYYLNFWFWSVSLYALIYLIQFPVLYALGLVLAGAFSWLAQLWLWDENRHWYELIILIFLVAQLVGAVYLLPLSFYAGGTIITLWFFFIGDKSLVTLRNFRWIFALLISIILLLLITALT
ncbi:MAG: hypothetical protein C3F02_03550 [Parcubacteria group bacterium]|nr:MAG: hypothetical protein C3F02_03550 [Parcubacteria group bacterium]